MNENGGTRGIRRGDAKRGSMSSITCYMETQKDREKPRDGDNVERQARLRMVVYSFIISCSFRLPLSQADGHHPPVM